MEDALSEVQIEEALRALQTLLIQFGEQVEESMERLIRGETIADIYGTPAEQIESMYAVASQLVNTSRPQEALPASLWLSAVQPNEPRFHFLAGVCLQQIGKTEAAARFYAQAVLLDDSYAGAVYRLAECLWEQGEKNEARLLFDAVVDMGRDDGDLRELQQAAQHRLTLH